MDNTKIMIVLFMNLVMVFILALIIITCLSKYRKIRTSYEKTSLLIVKEIFTDTDVGLLLICIVLFYYYTVPFIKDIPYLREQNYEEALGTIIQCDENGIVAEVTYRDYVTENIEIEGGYDLNKGEKIVVRYLPHTEIRMGWYISDDETVKSVHQETGTDSLFDNSVFMLCMALG